MLTIEFPWVQLAMILRFQHLAKLLNHRKECFLILHHEDHIIDKTDVLQPQLINHIMVESIKVVVHGILPQKMPNRPTDIVGFLELRFIIGDIVPFLWRRLSVTMEMRIAIHRPLKQIKQVIFIYSFVRFKYKA